MEEIEMKYEILKAIRTSNINNVGSGWVLHAIIEVGVGHVAEIIQKFKPEYVVGIS
jgi:Mg2+ and Co2+ transporter CorA